MGRIKLVMPQKRLLTAKTITSFVRWLNRDDPERSDWDRSDCVSILRAPDPQVMLFRLKCDAVVEALRGLNSVGCRPSDKRLITSWPMSAILADLSQRKKSIRECACGCGKWFLAERRNQRYYGDHRKRASNRRMTGERRERRRVQNRQAQQRYYAKNFKATPHAQGD